MNARPRSLTLAAALSALALNTAAAAPVCIRTLDIDRTEIPNDNTIIFHMRGGQTYRNALPQRCVGLRSASNGFTYSPTNPVTDELCDNLGSFRVNNGAGGGSVCLFGAFTPVK